MLQPRPASVCFTEPLPSSPFASSEMEPLDLGAFRRPPTEWVFDDRRVSGLWDQRLNKRPGRSDCPRHLRAATQVMPRCYLFSLSSW